MSFPVLYKYDSKGKVQQWQIFVEVDSFYTVEGQTGGKLTTSKPTVCKPKNIGKSNETTGEQQAKLEAASRHQKKLDNHYNIELSEQRSFYEPMLAETLEDYTKLLFTVRTFIQPKFDGVRAISKGNLLTSRGGKTWVTCAHLHQDEVVLDGELYNHIYKDNFNGLTSLFKNKSRHSSTLKSAGITVRCGCTISRNIPEYFLKDTKHWLNGMLLRPTPCTNWLRRLRSKTWRNWRKCTLNSWKKGMKDQ